MLLAAAIVSLIGRTMQAALVRPAAAEEFQVGRRGVVLHLPVEVRHQGGDRELGAGVPGASGAGPAGRGAVLSSLSKGIKEV